MTRAPLPESSELKWVAGQMPLDFRAVNILLLLLRSWKPSLEQWLRFTKQLYYDYDGHTHDSIENPNGDKWVVDPVHGDLHPNGSEQGIGDEVNQPIFCAVRNDIGLRGALICTPESDGGHVTILGVDETGIGPQSRDPEVSLNANRVVRLEGSAVVLEGDAGYYFRVPDGTTPGDIEHHYAKFGDLFTGQDGKLYIPLEVGPKIPVGFEDKFSSVADFDLIQSVPEIVVSGTLANNYTQETYFEWQVHVANLGDRACDFIIQPRHSGSPVGAPRVVTLSGDQATVTGSATFSSPPISATVVDVEVTAINYAHPNRPDPWVLGSTQPSTIRIYQEAP